MQIPQKFLGFGVSKFDIFSPEPGNSFREYKTELFLIQSKAGDLLEITEITTRRGKYLQVSFSSSSPRGNPGGFWRRVSDSLVWWMARNPELLHGVGKFIYSEAL